MSELGPAAEHRPSKRPKSTAQDRGQDLKAELLLKYSIQLPQSFTPGAIQANRLALRAQGDRFLAYVANAQHVYEVSLSSDLAAVGSPSWSGGVDQGKEGVLVPQAAQAGHIRQLDPLSHMAAEVQGLYAGVHGGHHLIAAVDGVGNARLLAAPLVAGTEATAEAVGGGEGDAAAGSLQCMSLRAPYRGECGWTGLALRPMGPVTAASGAPAADGVGGGGGAPALEVAVARQRLRDVNVYRDGALARTLHTIQGPTALTYLPPLGPSAGGGGGNGGEANGLLAVAEEHQVTLWDLRQGERGGCVQRLGVYGGGSPVYGMSWVSVAASRQQGGVGAGGGGGGGMLAVTGWERSVVMLEPRKWHIVTKWPGCVKYPATHLAPSEVAPAFTYVAGLDYECVAGRWDGSSGSSAGNANSASGGHGRACGPAQLQLGLGLREQQQGPQQGARKEAQREAVVDDGPEGDAGSRGGLSFRGDSKWLGLARESLLPYCGSAANGRESGGGGGGGCRREVAAALSLSGHLFVLVASAPKETAVA